MDPIKTIGTLLKGIEQRDAIHIAILPAMAVEDLSPGDAVRIVHGTKDQIRRVPMEDSTGVVDPFLNTWITKGSWVWVFLHPNSITSIRHEWTHPTVDEHHRPASFSETWLRGFADKWNFDYNDMITYASNPSKGTRSNFITARGRDLHSATELGADHELFWLHLEQLTKQKFDEKHIKNFIWSCSC